MAKGGVKGVTVGGEEGCSVGAIASKSQPSAPACILSTTPLATGMGINSVWIREN